MTYESQETLAGAAADGADAPGRNALYVYALLPEGATLPPGTTGLDGRPLHLVTAPGSGVAALVHHTAPAPYQGPDERVRQWVREQDAALVAVWEYVGTALPMTFNVLVAPDQEADAEQRVQEWLTARADVLRDLLGSLAGRAEVRVEISLDREAVTEDDEEAKALVEEMEGRSPGLRRMLAKRLERLRKEAGDRLADTLHAGVRQPARRRRRRHQCPLRPRPGGGRGQRLRGRPAGAPGGDRHGRRPPRRPPGGASRRPHPLPRPVAPYSFTELLTAPGEGPVADEG